MITTPCTYTVQFDLPEEPARRLPAGTLRIEINLLGRLRAESSYLRVSDAPVASSREFDSGQVMLDLDENGAPVGLEVLELRAKADAYPEFSRFAQRNAHRSLLLPMLWTTGSCWYTVSAGLRAIEVLRAAPKPPRLKRATQATIEAPMWCTPNRTAMNFCPA